MIGEPELPSGREIERQMLDITNELSNLSRELAQKNAELERLNALKNEFVGMAAHDLRSPLASILSFSDVLLEDSQSLSEIHVMGLTHIRHLSTSMLEMLNDLLDLTAIEAGCLKLNPRPCEPAALVREAVDMAKLPAHPKAIELCLEIAPASPPTATWDANKIHQVLNNLLSNAIKYSPRGARVEVALAPRPDAVLITVTDHGQGIAAEDVTNLSLIHI